MNTQEQREARIDEDRTILLLLSPLEDEAVVEHLCGSRYQLHDGQVDLPSFSGKNVYLCGELSQADSLALETAARVCIVKELSHGPARAGWQSVSLGQVPQFVHGVGVYYRSFFDPALESFSRICREHDFQSLTESNKPGTAHRTGIYLTPVVKEGEDLHFRLLRCSTNLSGPTENFRPPDVDIVDALNAAAAQVFANPAPLNHVLAQIYNNTAATSTEKQSKAKISAHADKTKDMPENGIMAFCTFYDGLEKLQPLEADSFDYGYKATSGLTKLVFRLKKSVSQTLAAELPPTFTLTLYPNSAFFMPLSTNRLYTHEIRSSMLDAKMLPTRMGYVVRCSSAEAVHTGGTTFLKKEDQLTALEPATPEGVAALRERYARENKTGDFVEYGDEFLFSMNQGDYRSPKP